MTYDMTGITVRDFTEPEKAWLAGVLDSEGSVGLYARHRPPHHRHITLQISNTNKEFVEAFRKTIGVGGMVIRKRKPEEIWGWKPQYQYILRGYARVMRVLDQIYPYLIVKKAKVDAIKDELARNPLGRNAETIKRFSITMAMKWQDPVWREKQLKIIQKEMEFRRAHSNWKELTSEDRRRLSRG